MKFLLNDLKKFIDINVSDSVIVDKLPFLGFEVENYIDNSFFIVVEILEIKKHPNSDRLKLCLVSTNKKETMEVVCGATNVRVGLRTVLAKVGSVLPANEMKIEPVKIRGIKSCGMLCSEDELGIRSDDDVDGIIELSDDTIVGQPFLDSIIDINITPNRGDCLSVLGIARELVAIVLGKQKDYVVPNIQYDYSCPIEVIDNIGGHYYSGIYIAGIDNTINTPPYILDTLQCYGIKSVSIVVDIMNYISILYNRPLHAYDADKIIDNKIIIDNPKKSEFLALDEMQYILKEGDIAINDPVQTHAIAGIIGAEVGKCTAKTKNIFIESAIFDADKITETGRRLSLNSDARYRFERKTDSNFVIVGLKIAAKMVMDLCAGKASEIVVIGKEKYKKNRVIKIDDWNYINDFTGCDITEEECKDILKSLQYKIFDDGSVHVPSWRNDVNDKNVLISDILRIYGYDNIPKVPILYNDKFSILHDTRDIKFSKCLVNRGMKEVITWSFMSSKNPYIKHEKDMFITNPVKEQLDYMRPSIVFNLIDVYKKNFDKGIKTVSIFECGTVFSSSTENNMLAGLRFGERYTRNIHGYQGMYDVFDVKADVECLLSTIGIKNISIKNSTNLEYYHPKKSGTFYLGNKIIACFGALNPLYIDKGINIFEIFIDNLANIKDKKPGKFYDSPYPDVKRDFGFVFPNNVVIDEIVQSISKLDKKIIKNVNLFDRFVKDNKLSLAFEVVLQSSEKTLENQAIEDISNKIIELVQNKFSAVLRRDCEI